MQHCQSAIDAFFSMRGAELHDPQAQARIEREFIDFQPARLMAAFKALPVDAPIGEVIALQRDMQPVALKPDTISWFWQRKGSGGFRQVCILPPSQKAAHYIILELLKNFSRLPAFICNAPGKGVQGGILRVKSALEEGYHHCFIGDIRNCFPSIRTERLADLLPLTSGLVENNLNPNRLNFRRANRGVAPIDVVGGASPSAPSGLLQGSPASNMVLAILLKGMEDVVSRLDLVLCLFSDNLFVAAKSAGELQAGMALIQSYLGDHTAGALDLHQMQTPALYQRFTYLGFEIQRRENNRVSAVPKAAVFDKIVGRLWNAAIMDIARGDGRPSALRTAHLAALKGNHAATAHFHVHLGVYAEGMLEDIYNAYEMRLSTNGLCEPNLGEDAP